MKTVKKGREKAVTGKKGFEVEENVLEDLSVQKCTACGGTGMNSKGTGPCFVCRVLKRTAGDSLKKGSSSVTTAPVVGGVITSEPPATTTPPRVKKVTPEDRKETQKAPAGKKAGKPSVTKGKAAKGKGSKGSKEKVVRLHEGAAGNVIKKEYRDRYGKLGRCDDDLAVRMEEVLDPLDKDARRDRVVSIAKDNGIDAESRWGHLNTGMMRMNLGNMLRRILKEGGKVTVR